MSKPILITPGDPDGIGPEIVWKAIRAKTSKTPWICVGARAPFDRLKARVQEIGENEIDHLTKKKSPTVFLIPTPTASRDFLPGFQSGWSIEKAARWVLDGRASALVTGPISKERLQRGGFQFPGHTEMLAELCGVKTGVTMMLANEKLRISLVTTHVSLKDVSSNLTAEKIHRAVSQTADWLTQWFGVKKPRIAVAALNPHAGESGIFGHEEIDTISPALEYLRKSLPRCEIHGPLPADTLFANHILAKKNDRFDAVVCMYHDQGLIPVKLLDFHRTVNVTLGLPMIRTSVDHGVGFDIAGKNRANPSSLISAIKLAEKLIKESRT